MTTYDVQPREHGDDRIRLVEVSGELDLTNAQDFEARVDELFEGDVAVVLDLNRVLFVDSAALHTLFRIARAQGPGRFGFVLEPTAAIARTFEIVGITRIVPTQSRVDALLAEIAGAPR
jgi:anti-anti-sigma factor